MSRDSLPEQGSKQVLDFWFRECEASDWWQKNDKFDEALATRFSHLHQQAVACELWAWRETPEGSLAEVIILDQFSRNMFRDTPQAFASDPQALVLAQVAIGKGFDMQLPEIERRFLYMPFMHSESLIIHEQAVALFTKLGNKHSLDFEYKHKQIIEQFGRYPHRNAILGRLSSAEEVEFLKEPGSGF